AALPGIFEAREAAFDLAGFRLQHLRLFALHDRVGIERADGRPLLAEDRGELALRPVDVEGHADGAGAARAIAERDIGAVVVVDVAPELEQRRGARGKPQARLLVPDGAHRPFALVPRIDFGVADARGDREGIARTLAV